MKLVFLAALGLTAIFIAQAFVVVTDEQEDDTTITTVTSTTSWLKTFPIPQTKTRKPPAVIPRRTTTAPVRVAEAVTIWVPVVLFAVTLIGGFGFLAAIVKGAIGSSNNRIRVNQGAF